MPLTGSSTADGYHVWSGSPPAGEDNLLALCNADSAGNASVAGGVRVKSYDLKRHRVTVVPVGSSQPSFTKAELQASLNSIYAQAVTEWEITFEEPIDASGLAVTPEVNETDYSNDMRAIWRAYVGQRNTVPGTTYLFIIPGFANNTSMVGYMPLRSGYGFLSPTATTRDAAHELGHGVFNLRHTFSDNNVVNLPQGSTQNLMDYSTGSELFKYQWDYIHNPEGGWFVFEDSEEGAAQLYPDPVCLQQILEQFRYAYVNKSHFSRVAHGYPKTGNWASNIMLSDGKTYSKIKVLVMNDVNSQPFDFANSPQSTYKWGSVMKIDVDDKLSDFYSYLFPTEEEWNQQVNNLVETISTETDRTELLNKLSILPYQEYIRFTRDVRRNILQKIAYGVITEDRISCRNDEKILINLVKFVPDEQLSELFLTLKEGNLMQEFCSKIQNAFGEENYTGFIGALTSSFMRYKKDEMSFVVNNWKEYTSEQLNNDKHTHFIWDRDFSLLNRITYRKHYDDNKIIIKTWPGGMFDIINGDAYSFTRPPLDPFDIVTVYFRTPPKHVSENIPANVWLAMPAFMFEWYLNEFHNKQIAAHIDGLVTIGSFIIPVTSLSKGYKVLSIIHASIGAINLSLLNSRFEKIVENNLSVIDPTALDKWESFNYLVSVAASPFQDIVFDQHLRNTTQFFAIWNIFKNTEDYGYLMNDDASKEAILMFEGLYESIKTTIENE